MAIQTKFKKIVKNLMSPNLHNRAKGIDQLRKSLQEDVYLESLVYLLEQAGSSFPKSVEDWDDGSYHLVGFCSEFPHSDLVKPIEHNFEKYSDRAKLQALYLLITINSDLARDAYIRLIENYSDQSNLVIDVAHIFEETDWTPVLVKKLIPFIQNEKLKSSIFHMILLCMRAKLSVSFTSDEKGFIRNQIIINYKVRKSAYLAYDEDYSLQFVYQAWKDSYAMIRSEMGIFLQLMQYFFDEEIQEYLLEALHFNDAYLKVDAVISLLERGFDVPPHTIEACANSIEACIWFYNRLDESSRKQYFKMSNEEIQHRFVKNRLFYYLIEHEEFGTVPDEIEVIKRFDTKNDDGQEITYYLTRFRSNRDDWSKKDWMTAYVGAYLTEHLPSTQLFDRTITTFTRWDQFLEDEHINEFDSIIKKENEEIAKEIIFESKPKWHYGTIVLGFIAAIKTVTSVSSNDPVYFVLLSLLWAFVLFKIYATIKLRKESKIILRSRELTYIKKNMIKTIELHKIYRMTMEPRKWGKNEGKMAGYQLKVKYIVFYDKDDNELLAIPSTMINPSQLFSEIQLLTEHLVEPPIIDVYESDLSA